MPQDNIMQRMTRIRNNARDRLDRVGEVVPPARYDRTPDIHEYLAQAEDAALRDPDFAQQLDRAVKQYRAVKGVFNA